MIERRCWIYRQALPVALAAALLFAVVALFVSVGATVPLDIYAKDLVAPWQGGLFTTVATVFTTLGYAEGLVPVAVVMGLLVARQGRRDEAILPLLSLVAEWLADPALKGIFHRQRPTTQLWPPGLFGVDQFSFPSGHAMSSMALYSLLLFWAWSYSPVRLRVPLTILAALMPIAIGLSRVALGVHWFSDVVGGWLAGVTVMAVVVAVWMRVRRGRGA